MNPVAIQYIWKAILESERSDELQFMDDEMLITAAAHASPQPRLDQFSVVGREPIAEAAISLKLVDSNSLQADRPVGG
jgi:hypothetical protein